MMSQQCIDKERRVVISGRGQVDDKAIETQRRMVNNTDMDKKQMVLFSKGQWNRPITIPITKPIIHILPKKDHVSHSVGLLFGVQEITLIGNTSPGLQYSYVGSVAFAMHICIRQCRCNSCKRQLRRCDKHAKGMTNNMIDEHIYRRDHRQKYLFVSFAIVFRAI